MSIQHIKQMLQTITSINKFFKITVSQDQKHPLHHEHGIPTMLYFDQLSTISKHLSQLKHDQNNPSIPDINRIDNSTNIF